MERSRLRSSWAAVKKRWYLSRGFITYLTRDVSGSPGGLVSVAPVQAGVSLQTTGVAAWLSSGSSRVASGAASAHFHHPVHHEWIMKGLFLFLVCRIGCLAWWGRSSCTYSFLFHAFFFKRSCCWDWIVEPCTGGSLLRPHLQPVTCPTPTHQHLHRWEHTGLFKQLANSLCLDLLQLKTSILLPIGATPLNMLLVVRWSPAHSHASATG